MFIVLILLLLGLAIGFIVWNWILIKSYRRDNSDDFVILRYVISGIAFVVAIGVFIAEICLISSVATSHVYDQKIEVVEEANKELEDQIRAAVDSYLNYENNAIKEMYGDVTDATTAIGIYLVVPELKGNEVVSRLIDTYQENTEEVKRLKLQKAELSLKKFLAYFGR